MLTPATEKTCAVCPKTFRLVRSSMQVVCSVRCAQRFAKALRLAAEKRERESTKARKEALKTLADWTREAQTAFNAWVRARDIGAGHGCIDCGQPFTFGTLTGGSVDAGHYLSRGSAPHLKFDERNVFAQRKGCNRPGGATRADFRAGVIARIGLPAVEALEADQSTKRYRADELKAIRDLYRKKLRDLRAKENA